MPTPVNVVGNDGNIGRITKFGQQVVAPIDYSAPVFKEITAVNTAVNFIVPKTGQSIVVTDIFLSTDRSAPTIGSRVEIYESLAADGAEGLIAEESILTEDLPRQDHITANGLNLFVPGGRWINAKSDGANVLITIMFYRVPMME